MIKIFSFFIKRKQNLPPDLPEVEKIHNFLLKLRLRLLGVYFFKVVAELLALVAGVFLCAGFILRISVDFEPEFLRNFFYIVLFFGAVVIVGRRFFLFIKNSSDRNLIQLAENSDLKLKDDLSNAYSLLLSGVATSARDETAPFPITEGMRALSLAHIVKTAAELDFVQYKKVIPFPRLKEVARLPAVALIGCVIFFRLIYPERFKDTFGFVFPTAMAVDFAKNAVVVPGDRYDSEITPGSEVDVGIALPQKMVSLSSGGGYIIKPRLFMIRERGGRKSKSFYILEDEDARTVTLSTSSVRGKEKENYILWSKKFIPDFPEEIKYYFYINNLRVTKDYSIRVLPPAVFSSFRIRYDYPDYTAMPSQIKEDEPHIECYAGTRVTIEAFAPSRFPDEAFIYVGGKKLPMVIRRKGKKEYDASYMATVSFVAGSFMNSYRFVTVKNGREYLSPEYPIDIKKDLPPTVEILSPRFDMDASRDDKIPVVWSAEDDFGVVKAMMNLIVSKGQEVGGGRTKELIVPLPLDSPSQRSIISEYIIDLAQFRFETGKSFSVRYFVTALDAAGNRTDSSKVNTIFLSSYEDFHSSIMKNLADISSKITDVWSDEIKARNLLTDTTSFLPWEEVEKSQKDILRRAEDLSKKFETTLGDMSRDPYFDGYLIEEYRGMASAMKHLVSNPLKKAIASSQGKDAAGVKAAQDEAISILENLALLSSDVARYQRVGDIENDISRMEKRLGYALEAMKNFSGDKESVNSIISDLDEISRLISDIENAIRDMPQMLPEEYINSEGVKEADFPSARSALEDARDSLLKGDINESRRLIEELKKQLLRLRDSLKKASENLSVRSTPSTLSANFRRSASEVDDIVRKQKEILKKVTAYEAVRVENFSNYQKKILGSLAVRQKDLTKQVEVLISSYNFRDERLVSSLSLMERVYREFADGKVYNSRKYMEDVINNFSSVKSGIGDKNGGQVISAVLLKEEEIYNVLRSTPVLPFYGFNEKEKKDLLSAAQSQDGLKLELDRIAEGVSKLSKQTAIISYETISRLKDASAEMGFSSKELRDYNTSSSIEHQLKVIELLEDSSSELMSAAASGASLSFGSRPTPTILPSGISRNWQGMGGVTGAVSSKEVKLPSAQDYKVPAAFREDIMKYLKERRPRDYDEVILKYYRRLAE